MCQKQPVNPSDPLPHQLFDQIENCCLEQAYMLIQMDTLRLHSPILRYPKPFRNCPIHDWQISPALKLQLHTVKGQLTHDKSPICEHHIFSLPVKRVLLVILLALTMNFLWSETCPRSHSVELYHLPKLCTGFSTREGITSPAI